MRNYRDAFNALNRASNLAMYGEPDYADMAEAHGVGLAKNHAFVDVNKLVRFLCMLPLAK